MSVVECKRNVGGHCVCFPINTDGQSYDLVRKEIKISILIAFGIPVKLFGITHNLKL
jgi:hypothetical protein